MHYTYRPRLEALKPDQRFVGIRYAPRDCVFLTAKFDGREMYALTDDGKEYRLKDGKFEEKEGDDKLYPFWTLPLPNLPDVEAIKYMLALVRVKKAPLLLHVVSVGEDFSVAKLVFSGFESGHNILMPEYDDINLPAFSKAGTAMIMDDDLLVPTDCLPEGCEPDDLLVCQTFSCEYEEGRLVTRPARDGVTIVGRGVSVDTVQDYVPFVEPPAGGQDTWVPAAPKFIDVEDFAHEMVAAQTRTEPNDALVLWTRKGDGEDTQCSFISHMGYTFHMADNPADHFYGAGVEPGLWLCTRAGWWGYTSYEGEHDSGIGADWVPATPEDAERFGFSMEELSEEIAELLDEEFPEDDKPRLADIWMEKARSAAEKQALDPQP